ncbi:ribonuclease P subunit P30 [Methanobrevibacter ruminantium M1]|uniref:Ribonuclease P protein component 3 n=1 Tax=Methanobrevibacter ruminantium (strain ATCC 35063 / DSM 1093 / JCM 13430 / OCM 146 / M1) TaxID=634498 RepID=D3E3U9_METRM|nr:RNase P subunit p30 family protein [Methanobrevibacter ruminantium]ADC47210.1 ribonuclease P subunit P30 [Methanobrevibacter ruminantium M1]
MKFHDLNIRGTDYNNDLALIKEAYKFGWDYLNLNYSQDHYKEALSYKDDLLEEISLFEWKDSYRNKYNSQSIEISMGINIQNANSNEIRKIVNKYRNNCSYMSALGGDLKVNRSVCENHRMDVLSRPYYKRRDSGMNHVLAKEAARNNVAIELCFRDVLKNSLKFRANIISSFKEIMMFHRKYNFPIILTTDSKSIYDIRSTKDIVGFFKSIGFSDKEIYNGFYYYPREIIDFNRQRKNMVIKGVKVIEGASDFTEIDSKTPKFEESECFDEAISQKEDDFFDCDESEDDFSDYDEEDEVFVGESEDEFTDVEFESLEKEDLL